MRRPSEPPLAAAAVRTTLRKCWRRSCPSQRCGVPALTLSRGAQDSLQNCRMLLPKPPRKDIVKYKQFAGRLLRFRARWDSERPEEAQRSFILSFYPSDDTVSIWETSGDARNTGLVSGKFLERMRLPKPPAPPGAAGAGRGAGPVYYGREDMQVGAAVEAQGRRFVLEAMDEATARLLDHHPVAHTPRAAASTLGGGGDGAAAGDAAGVLARLRERVVGEEARRRVWAALRGRDEAGSGRLAVEEVLEVLGERLYGVRDQDLFAFVDAFRDHDRHPPLGRAGGVREGWSGVSGGGPQRGTGNCD